MRSNAGRCSPKCRDFYTRVVKRSIALPLRGSFQELGDLFREYALKNDDGEFGRIVEEAMANRPTLEMLSEELEVFGLEDVDVEVRQSSLWFDNGAHSSRIRCAGC